MELLNHKNVILFYIISFILVGCTDQNIDVITDQHQTSTNKEDFVSFTIKTSVDSINTRGTESNWLITDTYRELWKDLYFGAGTGVNYGNPVTKGYTFQCNHLSTINSLSLVNDSGIECTTSSWSDNYLHFQVSIDKNKFKDIKDGKLLILLHNDQPFPGGIVDWKQYNISKPPFADYIDDQTRLPDNNKSQVVGVKTFGYYNIINYDNGESLDFDNRVLTVSNLNSYFLVLSDEFGNGDDDDHNFFSWFDVIPDRPVEDIVEEWSFGRPQTFYNTITSVINLTTQECCPRLGKMTTHSMGDRPLYTTSFDKDPDSEFGFIGNCTVSSIYSTTNNLIKCKEDGRLFTPITSKILSMPYGLLDIYNHSDYWPLDNSSGKLKYLIITEYIPGYKDPVHEANRCVIDLSTFDIKPGCVYILKNRNGSCLFSSSPTRSNKNEEPECFEIEEIPIN